MIDTSSEAQAQLELNSEIIETLEAMARKTIESVNRQTIEAYRTRVKSIADLIDYDLPNRPYRVNTGIEHNPLEITNPCHFVDKVLELKTKKNWTPGTWRLTRSAINYIFADQYCNGKEEDKAGYITGLYHAKIYTKTERDQKKRRDKISEQKHITPSEINRIISHLANGRAGSVWLERTAIFVMAGLATGLRPIEWETALWDTPEKKELLVKTAKFKQEDLKKMGVDSDGQDSNRALSLPFPETAGKLPEDFEEAEEGISGLPGLQDARELFRLVPVEPYDVHWVDKQLTHIQNYLDEGKNFKGYFDSVRVNLWRCCREIFGEGNGISFYTMRHQFIANSRVIRGPDETSRVAGNSRRAMRDYSGSRVAHVSVRQNAAGKQVLTPSEKAAMEYMAIREQRMNLAAAKEAQRVQD